MKLESIILGTGSTIGHLVSAGLAIDAVNNAFNGNYEMAAVEGIASAYIQISKHLCRKRQGMIQDFSDRVHNEYVPQMNAISQRLISDSQ
ncbi:MAG: hypothetical protein IIA87_05220 [Nanoarchaeota archaeon]|nr:hypothetical protein [Nanoarchaeota archaeon]